MDRQNSELQRLLSQYADILAESDAGKILKTYGLIAQKQTFIGNLFQEALRNQMCLTSDDVLAVKDDKDSIDTVEVSFKKGIWTILNGCRAGRNSTSQIEQLCMDNAAFMFKNFPASKHQTVTDALALYLKLTERKVIYLGRVFPTALHNFDGSGDTFVMYYYKKCSQTDPKEWSQLLTKFFTLVDQASLITGGPQFLFVDCDLSGPVGPEGAKINKIVHYQQGEMVLDDTDEEGSRDVIALAKSTIKPTKSIPAKKRGNVVLPCPASFKAGRCLEKNHNWSCFECEQPLEYGFDDYFYCKCGQSRAESHTYCCGQPRHRSEYVAYPATVLAKSLDQIRPFKEINILLLGETGVGKSTWINGFANYVTHSSLDEALDEPVCLVPECFSMTDEQFEFRNTATGNSEGETHSKYSAQLPKTYVFRKDSYIVRLVDTSGFGDSKGLDYDKEDFKYIMNYLANYESLHGICILLRSNHVELTAAFQFFVKELLTQVHRNVCGNVVFVFTNTRSTSYRAGDTYQALQMLIQPIDGISLNWEEDTVYCVDNEAVRYLAAAKSGLSFPDNEKVNCRTSWERSAAETERLFQYICRRTPHTLRQTFFLQEVGRQILAFKKALEHIPKSIATDVQAISDTLDTISRLNEARQSVEERIHLGSHLHVDFELQDVSSRAVDPGVQKMINLVEERLSAARTVLQNTKNRANQLKQEMDEITKVSSKFNNHIKANALNIFSDAVEEHLLGLIKAEEEKAAVGADRTHLEDYRKALENHRQEQSLARGLGNHMPHDQEVALDIEAELKSLYRLPRNGPTIRHLVEGNHLTKVLQMPPLEAYYNPQKPRRKPQQILSQRGLKQLLENYSAAVQKNPAVLVDPPNRRQECTDATDTVNIHDLLLNSPTPHGNHNYYSNPRSAVGVPHYNVSARSDQHSFPSGYPRTHTEHKATIFIKGTAPNLQDQHMQYNVHESRASSYNPDVRTQPSSQLPYDPLLMQTMPTPYKDFASDAGQAFHNRSQTSFLDYRAHAMPEDNAAPIPVRDSGNVPHLRFSSGIRMYPPERATGTQSIHYSANIPPFSEGGSMPAQVSHMGYDNPPPSYRHGMVGGSNNLVQNQPSPFVRDPREYGQLYPFSGERPYEHNSGTAPQETLRAGSTPFFYGPDTPPNTLQSTQYGWQPFQNPTSASQHGAPNRTALHPASTRLNAPRY